MKSGSLWNQIRWIQNSGTMIYTCIRNMHNKILRKFYVSVVHFACTLSQRDFLSYDGYTLKCIQQKCKNVIEYSSRWHFWKFRIHRWFIHFHPVPGLFHYWALFNTSLLFPASEIVEIEVKQFWTSELISVTRPC